MTLNTSAPITMAIKIGRIHFFIHDTAFFSIITQASENVNPVIVRLFYIICSLFRIREGDSP